MGQRGPLGRLRAEDPMPTYWPDIQSFTRGAVKHNLIPMYRRLTSDQITPVVAYRRLVRPDHRHAPSFLFESVIGGQRIARYSYLGAQPMAKIIARGLNVEYRDHVDPKRSRSFTSNDPLAEMGRITATWHLGSSDQLPPFTGGWVGYAAYDTVRYLEPEKLSAAPGDDRGLPDLQMQLYRQIIAFDHVQKTLVVITHVLLDEHDSVPAAYAAGCDQLDRLVDRIQTTPAGTGPVELPMGDVDLHSPAPKLPASNTPPHTFEDMVLAAKRYIAAGDIFQVVLSHRFDVSSQADPFDVYRALRMVNPSPYMFYMQVEGAMLVGSSPEILCQVKDGLLTNRPLAGTRRRGRTEAEDKALEANLLADPKERAEHVMLVDLGRNDVGRVAVPGSIRLPQIMAIERYSHVMHISSTVTGRLNASLNCWDALRCTLPVGTVSGAPKIRAMQIIDELEAVRRGPYAGAVGYADFAGNMDMAIALRTMVVMPRASLGHWLYQIQAGAGIVADSDPTREHEETVNKAAALAKAIELADRALGHRKP